MPESPCPLVQPAHSRAPQIIRMPPMKASVVDTSGSLTNVAFAADADRNAPSVTLTSSNSCQQKDCAFFEM